MIAMLFKNKKIQLIFVLIAAMVFGLIGFYLGKKTIKEGETHTEIVYVKTEHSRWHVNLRKHFLLNIYWPVSLEHFLRAI